jgi:hypothetical protein
MIFSIAMVWDIVDDPDLSLIVKLEGGRVV